MNVRRTSVYHVEVNGDKDRLTRMVTTCSVPLAGSGIDPGQRIFARFRTKDDAQALAIASKMAEGDDFILFTGYGTHRREVARTRG